MPYSPGSLPTNQQAIRTAREFAELVGRIINATISACPIKFVEVERHELGFVAHCRDRIPAPMLLQNGQYLFAYQLLGLRRDDRYLTTLEYEYTYQRTEDPDSWIFRYEYQREPGENYPYPLAHLHINANPKDYPGNKPFPRLHIPTGRVTVEAVARHLLEEHAVPCISPNHWQDVLRETEAAFNEIQRRRFVHRADD